MASVNYRNPFQDPARNIEIQGNITGHFSEKRVYQKLVELCKEGHLARFAKTQAFGTLDRGGVDFLLGILAPNGLLVFFPLQVKSSAREARKHNQRPLQCVQALHDTGSTLKEDLLAQVNFYKSILNQKEPA